MTGRSAITASPFRRAALVSLSGLLLATQATGLAHETYARHTLCAEHGELIEQEGRSAAVPVAAGFHASTQGPSTGHAHEHCAVAARRAPNAPAAAPGSAVVVVLVATEGAPAPALPPRPPAIAPLRLAPKGSPPRA